MNNLYEFNLIMNYRKLECDGLLFVECQCMPGDVRVSGRSTAIYCFYSKRNQNMDNT